MDGWLLSRPGGRKVAATGARSDAEVAGMEQTTIPVPAGMPAYLARPDGPGPWPGVVVIFDAAGL